MAWRGLFLLPPGRYEVTVKVDFTVGHLGDSFIECYVVGSPEFYVGYFDVFYLPLVEVVDDVG